MTSTTGDQVFGMGVASAPARPHAFGWRTDIQALRGLAVLLVVIDHARFPYLPGGFLGVDIFFVISGFMITGLIVDGIDAGNFTFRAFYARRVRRLFPAVYATIAVTVLVAPFVLDPYEFGNLVAQVVGAFTFTVNVVLWRQVDYFNSGAALKPLLHTWSLSIEEQFYIVLPFVLLVVPARFRLAILSAAVIVSAAFCFVVVQRSPSAAFYFLPFRAWELGLGSVAAVLIRTFGGPWPTSFVLRTACVFILVAVPILVDERGHPGLAAWIVCLATAVLLVTSAARQAWPALLPFVWLGDRSYSLYLVHWPVLAFANNIFIGPVSGAVTLLLLAIGFIWMELQYRFIERPFRTLALTPRTIAAMILVPMAVSAAAFAWTLRPAAHLSSFRAENAGFAIACNYKTSFDAIEACQNSADPKTMIWGDSFAMHLVDALAPTLSGGLIQATRTVCGPFLDAAPVNGTQYTRQWGEQCIAFNRSVLNYLTRHPGIETVALSSSLLQYLPGGEPAPWQTLVRGEGGDRLQPLDTKRLVGELAKTVEALHAIGKRVVLIAPPPAVGFDIGRCLSRAEAGAPTISPYRDCTFDRSAYAEARKPVLSFLAAARDAGVKVISFDSVLCGDGRCRTRWDDVNLYRDAGHLSVPGADLLGRKMELGRQVQRDAG